MATFTDNDKNQSILDAARKCVEELENRMNCKAQPLGAFEQDHLDTFFHYAIQMRRFVEHSEDLAAGCLVEAAMPSGALMHDAKGKAAT
jgi:hypothetical protein